MALAGLRLAELLNSTIGKMTPGDFATTAQPGLSTAKQTASSGPKVWVNTSSGVYHCPDTRWYGATRTGVYLAEAEAREKGYRPAYGKVCE